MEVVQLLTDGKISLYFGTIDKLEGNNHLDAYLEAIKYVFNMVRPFFDNRITIKTKKCINALCGIQQTTFLSKTFEYVVEEEDLYKRSFLEALYFSDNSEILIQSSRMKVVFSSDPVVVEITIN